jgi:zinc protease
LLLCGAGGVYAREAIPEPGPPRAVRLASPVERELANGLRVIVVPRRNVPLVVARMLFKTGADADPPGKAGVARLTADLIDQMTESRSAGLSARAVESLGAVVAGSVSWDASSVWAVAMTPQFRPAFTLFGEMVQQPVFDPGEVAGMKFQRATAMAASTADPSSLADALASRLLFGTGPYGLPMEGTPETLERIGRVDLLDFHYANFRPENAVLFFGGDIAPEDAFALAGKVFNNWSPPRTGSRKRADVENAPLRESQRVVLVDDPKAGQAAVTLAWRGVERNHPDMYAGLVADSVLSGSNGRLMRELRIKRGLTYAADSTFAPRRRAGEIKVSTLVDPAKVTEATSLLLDAVRGLGRERVPDDLLKTRKMTVIGGYARTTESMEGLMGQASLFAAYDLPLSEINTFIPKVEAVTAEEVRRFAENTFSREPVIVVVGNAKQIQDGLKRQYPQLRVLPRARLDLDRTDLLKPEEW